MTVRLYTVSDTYIDYLRVVDSRVQQNKNETRPYVVLGLTINGFDYYVPFTSPKMTATGVKKLKIYRKMYHGMVRQTDEHLGFLLFNNMIPVPDTEVRLMDLKKLFASDDNCDRRYAVLLTKQIDYIKKNLDAIQMSARTAYDLGVNAKLVVNPNDIESYIAGRCCDFKALEQASESYK